MTRLGAMGSERCPFHGAPSWRARPSLYPREGPPTRFQSRSCRNGLEDLRRRRTRRRQIGGRAGAEPRMASLHSGCNDGESPMGLVDSLIVGRRLSSSSAVRNKRRDQGRPAGLVRSSEPLTRVAVEIFVEEDPVVPSGVLVETTVTAIYGTMPISVPQEQP